MKRFSIIISLTFFVSIFAFPQWKWQNPIPTGNPLYAVFFTDPAHGYAAGDAGTILKTTDGGSTWTVHPVGKEVTCNSMFFPNDNTGFIAGRKQSGGGSILKTADAGNTWITVVSDTVAGLYSIYFPSNTNGYSAGLGGSFLKTTDGGNTWSHRDLGSSADIFSLWFTDDNTGYAAGYDDIDFNGFLLKTIDGGINWDTLLYLPNFTGLASILFTDANTGYVAGSHNLLKTVNAGLTWSVDSTGLGQFYNYNAYGSLLFTSQDTGYVEDWMGRVYQTTNAGASWHFQSVVNDGGAAMHFPDGNTGYAVTSISGTSSSKPSVKIKKTVNGGSSWSELSSGAILGSCLYSVFFPDDSTGYAGGDPALFMKTTNGGKEWSNSYLSYPANCLSLFFTGRNVGFMSGDGGYVGKTTDGGVTWTKMPTGTNNRLNSIFFSNPNTGYAVGVNLTTSQNHGIVLKTVNSGETWSATVVNDYLASVYFPDSLTGYAVGESGGSSSSAYFPVILKTTDGGNTWNKLSYLATSNGYFNSVFFTDASTGYVVGQGINYRASASKTTDGGETWTDLQLPANSYNARSVFFPTSSNGYIADASGNILFTTDAGSTWAADSCNTWNDLYSVFCPDSTAGYAVGAMSTILKKRIAGSTSVLEKQPRSTMFDLWPNPANNKITIRSEKIWNKEIDISILSMSGEPLLREKFNSQSQIELDVDMLAKGIYLVKIQSKKGIEVKKMVID